MLRYFTLLIAINLGLFLTNGIAQSAALVGPTQHFVSPPEPAPNGAELKALYRRSETIPFPASDPYTAKKVRLGRALFYDTRLSGHGALACVSCHTPGLGYGDGRAHSIGDTLVASTRRSPSIIDVAWGRDFMWDGRTPTLEALALAAIANPAVMNQPLDTLTDTIASIAEYRAMFTEAFASQDITPQTIAAALSTFERTVVSSPAPFDAWIDGDEAAIPAAAKRGFALFSGKAACASCHGGWLFNDQGFHDIGLPDDDLGRGTLFPTVLAMQHAFKTPSLRDVARRGPYMHDGSLPSLESVVAHYNGGGVSRSSRAQLVSPLGLTPPEQTDIVAFLKTLTSAATFAVAPMLPR